METHNSEAMKDLLRKEDEYGNVYGKKDEAPKEDADDAFRKAVEDSQWLDD